MRETVRVCVPRFLQVGKGSLGHVADILATIGTAKYPLIVTDKFMASHGIVDRVRDHLASADIRCGVFDETIPDPTDEVVHAGIDALVAGNHDSVIGLGGGSPIDTAKAIAVMAPHGRDLMKYRPPNETDVAGLAMIAIPTTAGTGSEVTHHTVIVHAETREKISCRGEAFVPTAAIVDYELTLSKPKRLIADNALDTLTHAIEGFVSKKSAAFSDRMALDCMRLVGQYLDRAYGDPDDAEAREHLMLAATLGGLAFSNASICLVHAMSRPLGSLFHVPHGMSNAMLLPTVTKFSLEPALDRYADCGRATGLADFADDDKTAARKLVDGLYAYNARLDVPSMASFGIDPAEFDSELDQMADDALRSGAPSNNPRIPDKEEIKDLFREAWSVGGP
ncbi:MAG: iron-containing alcohol dehydrogenase [Hyphomicrobiaceae bacterium]